MRVGIGFNPVLPVREMVRIAKKAEAMGFDSIWLHESLFQRDAVSYISSIAISTEKIRIGSGVINTFTRHPVTAASSFATLSELSGGRVIMGIGLGSFPTVPLIGQRIFPVKETRPLRRMREYFKIVRSLLDGERLEFDGEFFKVKGLELGFKVANKVPLFIASLSPMTLAYAGREADGVILSPALSTTIGTSRMISHVEKGEASRGRKIEKASYMLTSIDADPQVAKKKIIDYYFFVYQLAEVVRYEELEPYGVKEERLLQLRDAWKRGDIATAKSLIPDEAIEALTLTGNAEHVIERINEYVKSGVTLPIIMPIGDIDYAIEALSVNLPAR